MVAPPHGLFLTRDPHEGVWERSASRHGYGYVEGNPTNWTDLSGKTRGCGNKTCDELLREMLEVIKNERDGMFKRLMDMLLDECHQYERDPGYRGQPFSGELPAKCFDPNVEQTTWKGHKDALRDRQRGLDKAISCYKSRGRALERGTGDSSQTCDLNNLTYLGALLWGVKTLDVNNIEPGGNAPPIPSPLPYYAPPMPHRTPDCIGIFGICFNHVMLAVGIGFSLGHVLCGGHSGLLHAQP